MKDPTGKVSVNAFLLLFLSLGLSRCEDYFTQFGKEGDRSSSECSEKVVSLAAINPSADKAALTKKESIERWTTLDEDLLNKPGVIKAGEVKNDLSELNKCLEKEDRVKAVILEGKKVANKEQLVAALVEARRKSTGKNPDWVKERQSEK